MQRICKGDLVRLISGKESTKEGIVLSVSNKHGTAIVEGLNIVRRAQKASPANQNKGGIIAKEAPIKLCKLALVVSKAPQGISKVAYKVNKTGTKVRVAKKTNTELVAGKKT